MNRLLTQTMPLEISSIQLAKIFQNEPNLFFLDSGLSDSIDGRFSYLGFAPFKIVNPRNFEELRKAIKPYLGFKSQMPFACGAVGSIGYDGQMTFGLYEGVLCMDHLNETLTVTATGLPYQDKLLQKKAAQQRLDYILFKLYNHADQSPSNKNKLSSRLVLKSNISRSQYIGAIKKALKHIYKGDIYQINLSHRFETKIKNWRQYARPIEIYQNLRTLSPSSFSAYLDDGQQIILSSSPERFLKLTGQVAQVRPMKGTRPRGKNVLQDQKNKQDLLDSQKEKAELLMVTDLERNDLGRVCQYGSVHVMDMRTIEEYATVFQSTSTIKGVLRKECDQFDLLECTFPSGSVTGCPKIEAMKIIGQLEKSKRELYTGALGYISFSGDMDFNVLIRTLFLEQDKISFYVGGGIVADSNPSKEYQETLIKAKAMMEALKKSF